MAMSGASIAAAGRSGHHGRTPQVLTTDRGGAAAREERAMILLGCLLVFGLAVAPRAILILAWIFSERWPIVWGGDFLLPLLGIAFVPYTTIMYMLAWTPNGIEGWDWLWIGLGLFLDVAHWGQSIEKRKQVPVFKDM